MGIYSLNSTYQIAKVIEIFEKLPRRMLGGFFYDNHLPLDFHRQFNCSFDISDYKHLTVPM